MAGEDKAHREIHGDRVRARDAPAAWSPSHRRPRSREGACRGSSADPASSLPARWPLGVDGQRPAGSPRPRAPVVAQVDVPGEPRQMAAARQSERIEVCATRHTGRGSFQLAGAQRPCHGDGPDAARVRHLADGSVETVLARRSGPGPATLLHAAPRAAAARRPRSRISLTGDASHPRGRPAEERRGALGQPRDHWRLHLSPGRKPESRHSASTASASCRDARCLAEARPGASWRRSGSRADHKRCGVWHQILQC